MWDHPTNVAKYKGTKMEQRSMKSEKRKPCLYNSTFFVKNLGGAYCYVWTELDSKRGANEIGTCAKQFIKMQVKKGKKKIVIWSDNCGRQNRNKFLMSMYHKLVQETPNLELTQHCYLETGHMQIIQQIFSDLIFGDFAEDSYNAKTMKPRNRLPIEKDLNKMSVHLSMWSEQSIDSSHGDCKRSSKRESGQICIP
uniref:PiggyBac transposable element-derived protein domain-containing protein n=1 Tax=Romanomermis culicivorax TaxID=13658 RepID=A0A915KLF4_ROMCU